MVRRLFQLALIVSAVVFAADASASDISEITVAGEGEYTRITLAADGPIDHESIFLKDEAGRAIDLILSASNVTQNATTRPPEGAVSAYEILNGEIIFRLRQPMMVSRALDIAPTRSEPRHRLVIDLVRVAPVRFDRAATKDRAPRQPSLTNVSAEPDVALATRSPSAMSAHHVVVIDPGHGGHDPGASSHDNRREKAVVLKTALAVKAKLESSGRYTVHLTRDDDTFIEHEDRISMARRWGADLFISIHADAAGNSSVSGATVYTLSARGERRVDGTANENGWDMPIEDGTPQEVSGILADLIKRETKSSSSIFAELLVPELSKAGPIVRNSHRQANFFVLLAPDVPAVLVEVGFLTNRADVARVTSDEGQQKTAIAISDAINAYFDRRDLLFAAN